MSLVWRLRMGLRRFLPHTPAKRMAYGAVLLAAIAGGVLIGPAVGLSLVVAVVLARIVDLRLSRHRRGGLPTNRAYFFEGQDIASPRRR